MKKCLLIIPCIFSLFTHAAESNKPIMCLAGNTLFLVSRDDMCSYHKILGVAVVGKKEQDRFKEFTSPQEKDVVGTVFCVRDKKIYSLPKTSQSSSDDGSDKPFTGNSRLCKHAQIQQVESNLLYAIEPVVRCYHEKKLLPKLYTYHCIRAGAENPYVTTQTSYFNAQACEEANKDLILCYQRALMTGLELIKDNENKSIGLTTLSTETGFLREQAAATTFNTITDFLEKHSGYLFVQLFVRKHAEFRKYKELMVEYNEKYKK